MALSIQDCNLDPEELRLWDWIGILAYYGAGPRAKIDGICTKKFGFARRRVFKTIKLAKKISTL
jgi:hypothetical protein